MHTKTFNAVFKNGFNLVLGLIPRLPNKIKIHTKNKANRIKSDYCARNNRKKSNITILLFENGIFEGTIFLFFLGHQ